LLLFFIRERSAGLLRLKYRLEKIPGGLLDDPAGTKVTSPVIPLVQAIHLYAPACAGGVDELAVADIDAHMRGAASIGLEEDQVPWLELVARHRYASSELRAGRVWQLNTRLMPIDEAREPRAVEAAA